MEALAVLKRLREALVELDVFDSESIQRLCKQIAGELVDGKMGRVGMPLRAALTGTTSSPSVFMAAAVLGRSACLKRIDLALQKYDTSYAEQVQ